MLALDPKPRVLVSASAIGWYGDTGDRIVDETAPAGSGFLADVVRAWEAAASPAASAGIRVVHPRTGSWSRSPAAPGPACSRCSSSASAAGSAPGSQYWSWISLRDEVCALQFLLEQDHLTGPVNLTGPTPVRPTPR